MFHFVLGYILQVDAMRIGTKEFKKAYKKVNIDDIEVSLEFFLNIHLCFLC